MADYSYGNRKPHRRTIIRIQHILHFMALGKSDEWIAKHIKCSVKTVRGYRNRDYFWTEYERIKDRLPGKISRTKQFNNIELSRIKDLHAQGMSLGAIAKRMKCSNQRIYYVFKRLGLKANNKATTPFTDAEIDEMLRLRIQEKMTYGAIAKITGRNRSCIAQALKKYSFELLLDIPKSQLKKA